jgi:hypothetical protein
VDVGGVLQVSGTIGAVYVVNVLDVSRAGLRVNCPVPVAVGGRVRVTCCETEIDAEVRYCQETGPDEFGIGLKAESIIDLANFLEPILRFV